MTTEHFTLALPELPAEIQVTGAVGDEAMNALYRFDVDALVSADRGFAQRAIETPATLWMHFDNTPVRAVHGIVGACEATGQEEHGRPIFQIRIVPRLARLQLRRTSRIFQDLTTREIATHVLAISRVPHRWDLASEPPKRTYCVQYDETDYAFVARICAADGIFFSFDHPLDAPGAGETVVLADHVGAYTPIEGSFRFRPSVGNAGAMTNEEDHLQDFRVRHAMTTKRVLLRRFDFEKPPIPRRDAAGLDRGLSTDDMAEMRGFVDHGATVYEHQQTREQALLEPITAQTALEAETAGAAVVEGETAGRRLLPGHRFRLVEHSLPELDGEYVVTSCAHECRSPQWAGSQPIFKNRFKAVPASVPFRAVRPLRQVRQSIETATVVGPSGQEIHTDELGRVKVQFHWDLQGGFNDKSSAWLRVAQAWAGSGYGAQFLPRVGHEVLVGYIDGDPDRPIVVGSLHNGLLPPAVRLPERQTQSGIFTWSTPNGAGGNALLFDDQLGAEVVALRSSRTLELAASENAMLSANDQLTVAAGANMLARVGADYSAEIDGASSTVIGKDQKCVVGGVDTTLIKGARDAEVGGDDALRVGGNVQRTYAGQRTTVVGADPKMPGDDRLGVSGRYRVGSVGDMRLTSQTAIELSCGKSKILITPDSIILDAPTLQLQASDRIALVQGGGAATLTLAGAASLGGGTVACVAGGEDGMLARLFLDTEAHLDGVLVKLNCGPLGAAGGTPLGEDRPQGTVTFVLDKSAVSPGITELTLRIATPTGEVVERVCPVGGSVVMTGYVGDVFTVVEGLANRERIPLRTVSSSVPPKT